MKRIVLLILLLGFVYNTYCQSKAQQPKFPEVGKPMPFFELNDVSNYSKKKVNLEDFKGKWLVLDWWTKYCASCIESFPNVNELQKEFNDKVQFLFIGFTGSWLIGPPQARYYDRGEKVVRSIYERSKRTLNLVVPFAFDSVLYQRFNLGTCPYVVIVDPNGIVQAITYHLTSNNIKDLIEGKKVHLGSAYRRDQDKPEYDKTLPYLTYENGGSDTAYLFRSLLAKWRPNSPQYNPYKLISSDGRYEQLGSSIENLYKLAYVGQYLWQFGDSLYGTLYPTALLNVNDTSKFVTDWYIGKGVYSYSLSVPVEKASKVFLMEVMQRDLKNYFGYDVGFETRKMPCWMLTATQEAKEKLKTKGGPRHGQSLPGGGYIWTNMPVSALINNLALGFRDYDPFFDQTEIRGNIDITIDALTSNFKDVKRALNENGLDLVKGEKEMRVLVINDPKN